MSLLSCLQKLTLVGIFFLLTEERAVDLSCVVSCLAQLIIDPYFRTQEGFSFLVQREWTVMGHPFQRRNHLIQGTPDNDKAIFFNTLLI